jgi:alkylation response protein AidB-like acyl-CoA dehydrogenase
VCLVLEQHGRRPGLVPLWDTAVAALAMARMGTDDVKKLWLPGVVEGTTRLGLVSELTGRLVPATADAAVLVAGDDVRLVDLTDLPRQRVETTTRALASHVDVTGRSGERLGADGDWVLSAARLGLAAHQLGNADAGVREAAAYLSGREQFGRPLATFQAVSQQLADAYCDVQAMRATLWQAVWVLEQGQDARRAVDVASWWATDAGVRVVTAVQHLHGGIGADTTYPVHRRLLWALQTDALLGGASRQLARLGAALV